MPIIQITKIDTQQKKSLINHLINCFDKIKEAIKPINKQKTIDQYW